MSVVNFAHWAFRENFPVISAIFNGVPDTVSEEIRLLALPPKSIIFVMFFWIFPNVNDQYTGDNSC